MVKVRELKKERAQAIFEKVHSLKEAGEILFALLKNLIMGYDPGNLGGKDKSRRSLFFPGGYCAPRWDTVKGRVNFYGPEALGIKLNKIRWF